MITDFDLSCGRLAIVTRWLLNAIWGLKGISCRLVTWIVTQAAQWITIFGSTPFAAATSERAESQTHIQLHAPRYCNYKEMSRLWRMTSAVLRLNPYSLLYHSRPAEPADRPIAIIAREMKENVCRNQQNNAETPMFYTSVVTCHATVDHWTTVTVTISIESIGWPRHSLSYWVRAEHWDMKETPADMQFTMTQWPCKCFLSTKTQASIPQVKYWRLHETEKVGECVALSWMWYLDECSLKSNGNLKIV